MGVHARRTEQLRKKAATPLVAQTDPTKPEHATVLDRKGFLDNPSPWTHLHSKYRDAMKAYYITDSKFDAAKLKDILAGHHLKPRGDFCKAWLPYTI
ncbi:BQ5605_C003g01964 [Microbotryum silenes-dioicae]|uniref:BQ5605_C003g01964 protein n=1 Tax=Microbotryum silenes-dioicae TaxID=796604 RepID=A0A2X0M3V5_9BASI|nr:BQ5605_C003g01964 [Microbotryum silenes-dioicae]